MAGGARLARLGLGICAALHAWTPAQASEAAPPSELAPTAPPEPPPAAEVAPPPPIEPTEIAAEPPEVATTIPRPAPAVALPVAVAAPTAVVAAPAPTGWVLPYGVQLSGFIQADGQLYDRSSEDEIDPSTGATLNQTRYLIRRARLHLDIDHGRMAGSLELDANTVNGASAGVIDAEVTVRTRSPDDSGQPWAEATIGLLRTPWGYEVSQRDQDRFFLERSSVSRALFPGVFDLGVRVRGGWRFFDVRVALVNGDPLADRTFPVQDPNRAKDIVGRVGVSGLRRRVGFAAGVSGLSGLGFHRGTPETKDVLVWRDQNEDGLVQLSEIQIIPGSAATPSSNFHRFALGADARLIVAVPRLGALEVFGEVMWAANLDRGLVPADPVATGRDLRERGFVAGVVQELGAHFAVGARVEAYDPDADASEQRAIVVVPVDASFRTWTATAAWSWHALDRIVVEAQHFTNPLGRSPSGAPTTLGGDTIAVRGQLAW
jgi:hypothetical protein